MIGQTSLASLPSLRAYDSRRISSWNTSGENADFWRIEAGEKRVIGEIDEPGCIKHLWMTLGLPAEDYCRRIVLRMYWGRQRGAERRVSHRRFLRVGSRHAQEFHHRAAADEPAGR